MVTVYPEPGKFREIAKALLAVADEPRQVQSVTWPQAGFMVPEHVFDRFEAARTDQGDPPEQTGPVKRRPGRPRKDGASPTEFGAAMSQANPGKDK